jgi:hypothetical protein
MGTVETRIGYADANTYPYADAYTNPDANSDTYSNTNAHTDTCLHVLQRRHRVRAKPNRVERWRLLSLRCRRLVLVRCFGL